MRSSHCEQSIKFELLKTYARKCIIAIRTAANEFQVNHDLKIFPPQMDELKAKMRLNCVCDGISIYAGIRIGGP